MAVRATAWAVVFTVITDNFVSLLKRMDRWPQTRLFDKRWSCLLLQDKKNTKYVLTDTNLCLRWLTDIKIVFKHVSSCGYGANRPSQMVWLLDLLDSYIPLGEKIASLLLHSDLPTNDFQTSDTINSYPYWDAYIFIYIYVWCLLYESTILNTHQTTSIKHPTKMGPFISTRWHLNWWDLRLAIKVMVTVLSCGRLGFSCTASLAFPCMAGHLV